MGPIPPASKKKKGKSLPPTLLTPPILQQDPGRSKKTLASKRISYFDIKAAPTAAASKDPKPFAPLDDAETVMEGLGINFYTENEEEARENLERRGKVETEV